MSISNNNKNKLRTRSTGQDMASAKEPRVTFQHDTDADRREVDSSITDKADAEPQEEYYDPIYFDTDEEDDADQDVSGDQQWEDDDNQLESITKSMEASSIQYSKSKGKNKEKKKHKALSKDELLYDSDEDDKDFEWLQKKIAANRPPGTDPKDIWTDAILSCPMCWTNLCYDCQQHELYPTQFRAMFVERCKTIETEVLKYPAPPSSKRKAAAVVAANQGIDFLPSQQDDEDAIYHPVVCEMCETKVAVVDQDEVYHFFNIVPSNI